MKGEPKKYDKSKANRKAQMPMRTFPISNELLNYNQDFYEAFDYHVIMFITSAVVFLVTTTMNVTPIKAVSELVQSNTVFLIMTINVVSMIQNLTKNTFALGYFRFTDETKMEFFLGFKSFFVVYVLLRTFSTALLFDYDLVELNN